MPLKNAAKKYPLPFSPPFDPLATSSRIRHRFKVDFGSGEVDSLGIRAVGAWGRCRPTAADQNRLTTAAVTLGPTRFMPDVGFNIRRRPVVPLAQRWDYHDHYRLVRSSLNPGGGLSPSARLNGNRHRLHLRRAQGIQPNVYMTCLLFVATGLIESTLGYR
jgi:hypothetical protein